MELVSEQKNVVDGQAFWLGWRIVREKGWHTYWKSPGDIGLPTSIAWRTPSGVSVSPYEYPVPHKFELQGIVSYGYEDEVLLFTEMAFPTLTLIVLCF